MSFPSVNPFVNGIEDTQAIKESVKVRLFGVCLGPVDTLQSFRVVDGDVIGSKPDKVAMSLMELEKIQMTIAADCMIHRVKICQFCKKRPGISCKRME